MRERFGRWFAARWRRNWHWEHAITAVVAAAVYLFASEVLERELGDKSTLVKVVVFSLLALLLLVRWVRNHPAADHEDERPS